MSEELQALKQSGAETIEELIVVRSAVMRLPGNKMRGPGAGELARLRGSNGFSREFAAKFSELMKHG